MRAGRSDEEKKPTVLVVDDTPANIAFLVHLLGPICHVRTAMGGGRALELARSAEPPDLILLDVVMPGMTGYEVIAQLKDDPQTAEIPVIFITSLSDEENEERGLRLGAVDYIAKPFHAAIALARVESHLRLKRYQDLLKERSHLDGLTGLSNRRAFDETLAQEWRRAARLASPLSLLMLDVDKFKQFNDLYGHLMGDDCLRRIARELAAAARSNDFIGRYGGEEFVCLLPHTSSEGAMHFAKRLRQAVRDLGIVHEGSDVADHVTISLGVATVVPDGNTRPDRLLAVADQMLYRVKEQGRDGFCARDLDADPCPESAIAT